MSIRAGHPDLWAEMVRVSREIVGNWSEDEIANVMNKVHAPEPDLLMDHIGHVLAWCAAAQAGDNEEAQACVELWQLDDLPIEIFVDDDGGISHALNPDIDVRMDES